MNALYKLQTDMGMARQSTAPVPTRLRQKSTPTDGIDGRSEKISLGSYPAPLNGQISFDAKKADEKVTAQSNRGGARGALSTDNDKDKEKEDVERISSAHPVPSLSERAPMLYSNLQSYISSRRQSLDQVPAAQSYAPATSKSSPKSQTRASPSPSPHGVVSRGDSTVDLPVESGGGALEVGDILGRLMDVTLFPTVLHLLIIYLSTCMLLFLPQE